MQRLLSIMTALAVITACSSGPALIARPATVPAGVDLSGNWLLRSTEGTTQPAARETLVYVFLETGRSVKVTQTGAGLFISFDRSVVEEYRFGEQREVSVGEIRADRVSGWEGQSYVVETLDRNGARFIDRYSLAESGQVLKRNMSILTRDRVQLELEQIFDRT